MAESSKATMNQFRRLSDMLPTEVDPTDMAGAMIQHLWRVGDRTTADDLGDKIYEGFLTKSPKPFPKKTRIESYWTNFRSYEA